MMLVAAAAEAVEGPPADCDARDHVVTHHPTGRALGFGELALEAGKQPVPAAEAIAARSLS